MVAVYDEAPGGAEASSQPPPPPPLKLPRPQMVVMQPGSAAQTLRGMHANFLEAQCEYVVAHFEMARDSVGEALGRFADITRRSLLADRVLVEDLERRGETVRAQKRAQLGLLELRTAAQVAEVLQARAREEHAVVQKRVTDARDGLAVGRRLEEAGAAALKSTMLTFTLRVSNLEELEAEVKRDTATAVELSRRLTSASLKASMSRLKLAEAEAKDKRLDELAVEMRRLMDVHRDATAAYGDAALREGMRLTAHMLGGGGVRGARPLPRPASSLLRQAAASASAVEATTTATTTTAVVVDADHGQQKRRRASTEDHHQEEEGVSQKKSK
jgi:hypothetical protein